MGVGWFVVCFAVLLIGVTKSGFGSGVGLMIVPMTAIAMAHTPYGEKAALGLLLPLLILGDLLAVGQYRKLFDKRIVRRLMPGTLVGVVLGALLLWWIGKQHDELAAALMRVEIGIEAIVLVAIHWWRIWRGEQQKLITEPLRGNVTGAFAGISSTLAHAAGPVIALYLLPLHLDRRFFVGTTAVYFFILNTLKLPAYWRSGQFSAAPLNLSLRFVPLVIVGAAIGWWLNRHITDKLFSKVVYVLTFLLGWYILIDGTWLLLKRW
jgi:uncharacterized membrane protein YfcA